jgi:hypothetical protein
MKAEAPSVAAGADHYYSVENIRLEKAYGDEYTVGTEDGMVFATGSCALQVSDEMKSLLKAMRADVSQIKSDMHAMDATIAKARQDISRLQRSTAAQTTLLETVTSDTNKSADTLSDVEKFKKRLDTIIDERRGLDGLCMDTRTGYCPSSMRTWTFAFRTRCCFTGFY